MAEQSPQHDAPVEYLDSGWTVPRIVVAWLSSQVRQSLPQSLRPQLQQQSAVGFSCFGYWISCALLLPRSSDRLKSSEH